METKYIKQYIEDMEGDKRADNLTEFGECLLKELKQLLSVCEQKQTEQKSNCNLPHVSSSLRERELNKYLEEINTLMWNTWGVKHNKFDKEEGSKIMSILNRWASNSC